MSTAVSVPNRLRALAAAIRRPRELVARDWLRALVLAILTGLEFLAFNPSGEELLNGTPGLVAALISVAVVVVIRRHFPVAALVLAVGTAAVVPGAVSLIAFASYGVGYRVKRASVASAAIAVVSLADVAVWLGQVTPLNQDTIVVIVISLLVLVMPALFGRYHRQRAALVMSGWERAERLEHERSMMIEQARLRERTRIAQEMHDSLGHDLSLLALQAGALELDPTLPDRYRDTARTLRTTTTEAVERLREVIGILREEGESADGAPLQPATEGLDVLVERATGSGVDVSLEVEPDEGEGEPLRQLPPMAERAVYYAVREAITNATKHAPGAPIVVSVRRGAEETTASITNALVESASTADGTTAGTGLIGLAERIRLAGGEMATSTAGGTFTLTVRVPHDEQPADESLAATDAASDRAGSLPRYQPSIDELTEMYDRTASVGGLRRRLWLRLVTPVVLVVIGFAVVMTYIGMDRSTMPAESFAQLEVGMPRDEAARLLPVVQQSPPELERAEPPRPASATCRYYAPRLDRWMWADFHSTYRVCFADDRVVSVDHIEHPNTPRTNHQAGAANRDRVQPARGAAT